MEQAKALRDHGVEIAKRTEGKYAVTLYQIDSFYVEVYHLVEHNMDKRYRSFLSTNPLELYMNSIDISGLLDTDK